MMDKIDIRTIGWLSLLVKETKEILFDSLEPIEKLEKIDDLLNSWVVGFDLSPEKVRSLTKEEVEELVNLKKRL
jgi:hypothetical protein